MADRPIIFSAPMVRALLDGRKTQTRRVLKKRAALDALDVFEPKFLELPGNLDLVGYAPGDRLWVREAHSLHGAHVQHREDGQRWGPWGGLPMAISPDQTQVAYYREGFDRCSSHHWRPSIHMPRWASRLTLLVTDVRVQRLQDISEADAVAEGCAWSDVLKGFTACPQLGDNRFFSRRSARSSFEQLWGAVHDPATWNTNPWVAAVTFTVERRNIGARETGGER